MLIPKPILLPFTVNFMTGNLELAELINRLVHSFSYPKRYEIALRKWSRFSSSILEAINQYCQFPQFMMTEIDLGIRYHVTQRINGIVLQKGFIGPKDSQTCHEHTNIQATSYFRPTLLQKIISIRNCANIYISS